MIELIDSLRERFQVSQADLDKGQTYQARNGGRLEQILVNMGCLTEDDLAPLYSEILEQPLFNPQAWQNWQAEDFSPSDLTFLKSKNWLLLEEQQMPNGLLWTLAAKDPLDLEVIQYLQKRNIEAKVFIATDTDLQTFFYAIQATNESRVDDEELSGDEEARLRELALEAPTVNLLNTLITKALARGASDMHLEPHMGKFRVRYRIDGVLHEVDTLAPKMKLPITTRLKILSGMDIAEKRRPQDGKIEMRIANQELDIRVSALPLNDGESIVLRFFTKRVH
jgi:general secretion pathway protein E